MNKVRTVGPPSWVEDQEKPRLIVPIEPTEDEIKDWPFLNGLGGLLTKYRHPWLIWFCNTFVAYRISGDEKARLMKVLQDKLDEVEANKENMTPDQIARTNEAMSKVVDIIKKYRDQEKACKQSLDDLKDGKFEENEHLKMEDICSGGKYFNVSPESCEAWVRLIKLDPLKIDSLKSRKGSEYP